MTAESISWQQGQCDADIDHQMYGVHMYNLKKGLAELHQASIKSCL